MRYYFKTLLSLMTLVIIAGISRVDAQSLHNTAWKTYVTGLGDTLTLHISGGDSSFVTVSTGDVVVRSTFHVSNDTLSMSDFDGQYACQNGLGIYKFTVTDDKLVMKMVTDPCTDRGSAIDGATWNRAKIKENH